MSGDFRDKKGEDLVKYVASSTNQEEEKCREILRILCSEECPQPSDSLTDSALPLLADPRRRSPRLAEKRSTQGEDKSSLDIETLRKLREGSSDKFVREKLQQLGHSCEEIGRFMDELERCRVILGFSRSLTFQDYRTINDPIHGTIELHPLLVKIIDCPHFQRLRHIKQLGGVSYVYPGAIHTRFEHSIGVCHLAGEVMKNLKTKQPELGLTEKDVLCVEIAGLCHDLGHGPFSHMFDWVAKKIYKKWEHEVISCEVLDALIKENHLEHDFQMFGLNTTTDVAFVKDLIKGDRSKAEDERVYLYQIVANKESGCDVDKWDYYARDCYYLGIPCDFDFGRFVKGIRVATEPGGRQVKHLCLRDKEVNNVYGMFRTRGILHQKALQHKTSQAVQHMIKEALLLAKGVKIIANGTEKQSLEDIVTKAADEKRDLSAVGWKHFDDRILVLIMNTTEKDDDQLKNAQEILTRIEKREIYTYLGCVFIKKDQCSYFHDNFEESDLVELAEKHCGKPLKNLRVLRALISQSSESKEKSDKNHISQSSESKEKRDKNPVDLVKFYTKKNPTVTVEIKSEKVSPLVKPIAFSETCLQIYDTREGPETCDSCWKAFKDWADSIKNGSERVFQEISDLPERYPTTTS